MRRDAGTAARAGFTLIELLIVVAIVALMLTVALRLNRVLGSENDLDATANRISSAIEDARNESIVSGQRVFFEFALGESRDATQYFRSVKEPLPGHEKDAEDEEFLLTVSEWTALPQGVRIESVTLGETDPFTDGNVQIAIQPDGTMPSHLVRLWMPEVDPDRNRQAGWACIQVAGLLGQARVLNRFVEPEFLREDTFQ